MLITWHPIITNRSHVMLSMMLSSGIVLPDGANLVLRCACPNEKDTNSSTAVIFQVGPSSPRQSATLGLLQVTKHPPYTTLYTTGQSLACCFVVYRETLYYCDYLTGFSWLTVSTGHPLEHTICCRNWCSSRSLTTYAPSSSWGTAPGALIRMFVALNTHVSSFSQTRYVWGLYFSF